MITGTSIPSMDCGICTTGTSITLSTRCTTTGMSTILFKNWTTQRDGNCGTSTVFSTVNLSLSMICSTERWRARPGRRPRRQPQGQNGHVSSLVQELHGPQKRPQHNHGLVNNLVQNCTTPPAPPRHTIREPTLVLPGAAPD